MLYTFNYKEWTKKYWEGCMIHMHAKKYPNWWITSLTINQPLNQLFCTCIGPPLLLNWTTNAGGHLLWGHIKWDQYLISQYTNLIHSNNNTRRKQITNRKWYLQKQFLILIMQIEIIKQWNVRCDQTKKKSLCIGGKNLYQLP